MNEDLTAARARNIRDALAEDIGNADWTAMLVPAGCRRVRAHVQVRESAILCGREWFDGVFAALDPTSTINWHYAEGAAMQANTRVCDIGPTAARCSPPSARRSTSCSCSPAPPRSREPTSMPSKGQPQPAWLRCAGHPQTIPGLRLAQKYAVRVGGGQNQRLALYDGILIKENHIAASGGVTARAASCAGLARGRGHPDRSRDPGSAARGARCRRRERAARQLHRGPHARGRCAQRRPCPARSLRRRWH